jgi:predicted RecA/RadA family phage recombinase
VVQGVFDLPKVDEQEWTLGARIYWDATAEACTTVASTTAATNTLIGVAMAAVADTAGLTTGRVLLTGAFTQ